MLKIRSVFAYATVVMAVTLSTSAQSQNASPKRLRGAITAIDGTSVTIATREGATMQVKLADN